MQAFEVLDGGGAPEVEEVLPHADVTSAVSFASGDVRERVLDSGSFAKRGAALTGVLKLAILALSGFIGGDGHGAAAA
jgi:hypothetical protein